MNDALLTLVRRREELVARSARQRHQLAAAWSHPLLGHRGGQLWDQLRPWWRPVAAVLVPMVVVGVVRRPGWVLRAAKWLGPAWQAWRTVQRMTQSRSGR